MKQVLTLHEELIANVLKRQPKEILEDQVLKAIGECDHDGNGLICKKELNTWIVRMMEIEHHMGVHDHGGDHEHNCQLDEKTRMEVEKDIAQ